MLVPLTDSCHFVHGWLGSNGKEEAHIDRVPLPAPTNTQGSLKANTQASSLNRKCLSSSSSQQTCPPLPHPMILCPLAIDPAYPWGTVYYFILPSHQHCSSSSIFKYKLNLVSPLQVAKFTFEPIEHSDFRMKNVVGMSDSFVRSI